MFNFLVPFPCLFIHKLTPITHHQYFLLNYDYTHSKFLLEAIGPEVNNNDNNNNKFRWGTENKTGN